MSNEILLTLAIGWLFASAFYLTLRQDIVKILIGLVLLMNAVNLLVFTMGGLVAGHPLIVPARPDTHAFTGADPLPQALVLTAIVIAMGVQMFAFVLVKELYGKLASGDTELMRDEEPEE